MGEKGKRRKMGEGVGGPPAISRRRREILKRRGEDKHVREGGRADSGCLLGFRRGRKEERRSWRLV